MNFRISGQKIKIVCKTKYLGLLLDETLNFKSHIDSLKTILRRANCLLSKIRHYVKKDLLKAIYYALFDSHLRYGCQIWGQCQTQFLHNLEVLQNKGLRILNFRRPRENNQPLYKISKICKLKEFVRLYNLQFVQNHLNYFLPKNFLNYFTKATNLHDHNTRGIVLNVPNVNTTCYGSNTITLRAIREWNKLKTKLNQNSLLQDKNSPKILQFVKTQILDSYLQRQIQGEAQGARASPFFCDQLFFCNHFTLAYIL